MSERTEAAKDWIDVARKFREMASSLSDIWDRLASLDRDYSFMKFVDEDYPEQWESFDEEITKIGGWLHERKLEEFTAEVNRQEKTDENPSRGISLLSIAKDVVFDYFRSRKDLPVEMLGSDEFWDHVREQMGRVFAPDHEASNILGNIIFVAIEKTRGHKDPVRVAQAVGQDAVEAGPTQPCPKCWDTGRQPGAYCDCAAGQRLADMEQDVATVHDAVHRCRAPDCEAARARGERDRHGQHDAIQEAARAGNHDMGTIAMVDVNDAAQVGFGLRDLDSHPPGRLLFFWHQYEWERGPAVVTEIARMAYLAASDPDEVRILARIDGQ